MDEDFLDLIDQTFLYGQISGETMELADQVWDAWDKGLIDDQVACIAW